MRDKTYGLILAGGKSSRMGQDKLLIQYHSQPQYLHLYHLLQPYCNEVFVSCNQKQLSLIDPSINAIVDEGNFEGPLSAIRHAFNKYSVNWLIVPCDMPNIDGHLISQLMEETSTQKVVCSVDSSARLNPLLALYNLGNCNIIKKYMGKSATDYVKEVGYDTFVLNDKQSININSQKQLEKFKSNQG